MDVSNVPGDLMLPQASYAAWIALLQNLLTNAVRASLDAKPARIFIDGGRANKHAWLRVQNNGESVEVEESERLFLPFERNDASTGRSEALGLGGSGLGLTIVRMIADEIGCRVRFAEPEPGWSTAVEVRWKESDGK